jgi:hypothetical protein
MLPIILTGYTLIMLSLAALSAQSFGGFVLTFFALFFFPVTLAIYGHPETLLVIIAIACCFIALGFVVKVRRDRRAAAMFDEIDRIVGVDPRRK